MGRTPTIDNGLKRLLSCCQDVVVRYSLAHSLGLADVTKELLAADNGLVGAAIRDNTVSAGKPRQKH